VTVALNFVMYVVIPKGFLPQQDTGQLRGGIRGDAISSFQLMKSKLIQVVDLLQKDAAIATVVGTVGAGGGGPGGGWGSIPGGPSGGGGPGGGHGCVPGVGCGGWP